MSSINPIPNKEKRILLGILKDEENFKINRKYNLIFNIEGLNDPLLSLSKIAIQTDESSKR
jgi:hypothetical protein